MKKAAQIDYTEWQAALHELNQKSVDVVPPGWITPEQFSADPKNNVGVSHARKLLIDLFRNDFAERRKWSVLVGESGVRPLWHYKLKPKK